jgi:hypothetical protein
MPIKVQNYKLTPSFMVDPLIANCFLLVDSILLEGKTPKKCIPYILMHVNIKNYKLTPSFIANRLIPNCFLLIVSILSVGIITKEKLLINSFIIF